MGFHVARIFHSFIITTKQAKYQRPIKRTWSFTTIKYSLFLSNRLCFSQNEHKIIIISLLNLPFFFSHVLSLSFPSLFIYLSYTMLSTIRCMRILARHLALCLVIFTEEYLLTAIVSINCTGISWILAIFCS